jgi:hypothetical protein
VTDVAPNTAETLSFLRKWATPFVHLVGIKVDPITHEKVSPKDGGIVGQSFTRDDLDDDGPVQKWIDERQGIFNLYFTVNALRQPMVGKPKKSDIDTVVAFHVDIDVPAGEDQESTAKGLVDAVKQYPLDPSVIISSGGGVQAFWILQEADRIQLGGDVHKAEEAERYTRALEASFSGLRGAKADACHNVDRIMRLPGTINIADAKKLAKGRANALASLVLFDDLKYNIGAFQQAPRKGEVERPTSQPGKGGAVSSAPEEPLTSWGDPRLKDVPQDCIQALMDGKHPDHTDPHIHVVCQMVRANCSAQVIKMAYRLGKLADGSNAWPRKFEGEMDRLIRRALDLTRDEDLDRMNQRHAVININGKTKVLTWCKSQMFEGQYEAQLSSFDDFAKLHNRESKKFVVQTDKGSKNVVMPMGDWWLKNQWRRQYNGGFKFMPRCDAEEVDETLNLWRGFGVPAIPGNCDRFLKHCLEILCSGHKDLFDYLIRWMAFIVQKRTRTEVALLLRSDEEGTGKGMFCRYFGKLFGPHYMQVSQPSQVIGQFNPHLEKLLVLLADEALFAGDPRHRNALWALITEPTIAIEPKGVDIYRAESFLSLIINTNAEHAVQVEATARRIFALEVSKARLRDHVYFGELLDEMNGDGPAALLAYLQAVDLTDFNIRNIPDTEGLKQQKSLSRHGVDAVIEELCHSAMLPFQHRAKENCTSTYGEHLNEGFWSWCKNNFQDLRRENPRGLAVQFKKYGAVMWTSGVAYLKFPDLEDLRDAFEKKHGPQDWEGEPKDWVKKGAQPVSGEREVPPNHPDDKTGEIPF